MPIPFENWEGSEGDARNGNWQDMARLLRVRDLRVYDWPSAYIKTGVVKWQQTETLRKLRAAGYHVEESTWELTDGTNPPGFEARRPNELISAIWQNNGFHLLLYWGHPAPETPAQKRDDALIWAVIEGNQTKVQQLLNQGANPRAVDYAGSSVLTLAADGGSAGGNSAMVKALLVARKQRPASGAETDFELAFQAAVRQENTAVVQAFLDAGATPRQIGAALRVAASVGSSNSAKLLLSQAPQSDVDAALITASFVEIWRGTPIQYPEIVKLLLTRKPSQSALDAAMIAAAEDDENNVVQILLKAGADVKARDGNGQTALFRAAADLRDDHNVRALLDAGADPNARSNKGGTVLMHASGNYSNIIELLLARGADPSARNAEGNIFINALEKRLGYLDQGSALERARLRAIIESLKKTAAN